MARLLFILTLLISARAAGQYIVKGIVYDNESKPLPGVNVLEAGSEGGTVTDVNGKFTFNSHREKPTLVFSFIGMETAEVHFDSSDFVSLQMKLDPALLSLSGSPFYCVLYARYSSIGISSGLRYTPIGFRINNVTPYAFGISPDVSSTVAWRTDGASNRYLEISLGRNTILRSRRSTAGLHAAFKRFKVNSAEITNTTVAPVIVIRNVTLSAGYCYQKNSGNEQQRSGHGFSAGFKAFVVPHLAIDLKTAYILSRWQHDASLSFYIPNTRLSVDLNYERLGNFDEVATSVQYRFSY